MAEPGGGGAGWPPLLAAASGRRSAGLRRIFFAGASALAYGRLAWLYEAVAWLFSNGEWHLWRRQALVVLRAVRDATAARILEVGCGSGALLVELAAVGSGGVIGLDPSRPLLRAAQRRLRRAGLARAWCVCGEAQSAPLADASLDAIILTFPTAYVFDLRVWQEFARLLAPDGCVIWVDSGEVFRPNPIARALQAVLSPDPAVQRLMEAMPAHLHPLGLDAAWQTHTLAHSRIAVLLARRTG